ncbi:putative amidohydrolase [Cytobacillus firmus]|uniref:Putative amidohydrolase n=2 Tax=Cytobacillus TaxID=2675230 RepID=A0A366JFD8_CYTFI|nr:MULTISPECIES: nitrilase-related carbon-nitrogen hydrolase [Cytobacillus]RBP85477.1 putative amidohydrolase [Cytobacillus firmus]TDX35944.1 putative amidohydrolase [Cytobacillus oceanisediminis]
MKIGIAQVAPLFGNVQANLSQMKDIMHENSGKAELLVFPELSLTGYDLKDQLFNVALTIDAKEILQVCEISADTGVNVVFGFVEKGKGEQIYNSAIMIQNGKITSVQRKIYPTNYGDFEEAKYFARGKKVNMDQIDSFISSMLICNDVWHPSLPHIAAHHHTSLLIALINSPEGGLGSEYSSSTGWERVGQFYASVYGCYVVLVNRVGIENGIMFYGNSKVINPYGEVILQCPYGDPAVQICEIDYKAVKEIRKLLPIMRDEDVHITLKHFKEIADQDFV